MYQRHLENVIAKDVRASNIDVTALDDNAKKALQEKHEKPARDSASGEYLACLFLLLADNDRFGPLKLQLDNNFLVGEQEYPKDVLAAKRLMTNFSPPIGTKKQAREKVQATDVAFVEAGAKPWHTKKEWQTDPPGECYCCGKRHPGGYLKCLNLSDGARHRMTKMVEAGHFASFPPLR